MYCLMKEYLKIMYVIKDYLKTTYCMKDYLMTMIEERLPKDHVLLDVMA